ncbi:nitrate/nitrite transporter NrtS [Denitromonas iodatirespirans]|uniref:Nitrate/nitrite transporter NrtS n=1 Tax=Denitromonas iodatirespirans TaxID=2795389 RepID=A0A944DK57_DENI1|nr:nitrate/nitrite transporter NrtS [Denitromonas iodatirespirans]MBT0960274.1 nitrate/nitrite transporter NrtS [Denitromonas iodatirespirans]
MKRLLCIACRWPIVCSALKVSLTVGIVLNLINQGAPTFAGEPLDWSKIVLNFVVPYCVSSYSAALAEWRATRTNA